jgi:hypothetical protein
MARGKPLSDDTRGVVLNMARYLSAAMIANYTGIGKRTFHGILEDYLKRESITLAHLMHIMSGKKRRLSSADERTAAATSDLHRTLYLSDFSMNFGQFSCGAHVKMPINIVLPIQNYPTCCNSIANEQASLIEPLKNGNIKTPYFRVPFAGAQHY